MSLLKVLNDAPGYAKIGLQGPQGSGKSRTAVEIAFTIHKLFKSKKPIAFFDTETGSDYLKDLIEERTGMEPLRVKTRAFSQLMEVIRECRAGASDILIVDSITHVWRELQDAYMARLNQGRQYVKTRMDIQDIMQIKKEWYPFPDEFLTSPLHILICGREGKEWGHEEDEETGKRELISTGTKMKVEGEFGYESSLILQMHSEQIGRRILVKKEKGGKKRTTAPTNIKVYATVLKDRFDEMNGAIFEMPTGEHFLPFLKRLRPAAHGVVDTTQHTTETLPEMDGGYMRAKTDREITVEKIQAQLLRAWPGQTAVEKKARNDAFDQFFQTRSWTEIEKRIKLPLLVSGLAALTQFVDDLEAMRKEAPPADDDVPASSVAAEATANGNGNGAAAKPRKPRGGKPEVAAAIEAQAPITGASLLAQATSMNDAEGVPS